MTAHSENELLTVEQFAQRFQVSRSTVFGWLKKGHLREGVHYLRLGRILRFRWPCFLTEQPTLQTVRNIECKSRRSGRD